ncbi:MAG TPA: alpha/beta hydrolase, partial [Chloroflexota bacterium]|nr:alpha/beta hydrolase [Chloroflexota bacterium]
HVLGHSFGGGLGLELYRRHPGTPRSLLLAGAYAGWAGSLPREEVEERLRLALRMADQLPMPVELDAIPGLLTNAMPAERIEELTAIMADVRPVGTRVTARAFAEADLRDVLPHIAVPTLLLYGAADERAPLDVAKALEASIPDSTLVTMPGLGHEAYLEAPRTFNAEVRRFLHSLS